MPLGVDLDGEIRRVDPDRWLSSRFIANPERRAEVVALYAFDHELARAETAASNPLAAEIRLAWWRETLAEIIAGEPVRRHPTAEALAGAVRTHTLPQMTFEAMIEARIENLDRQILNSGEAMAFAKASQGGLARLAALVLGAGEAASGAEAAGTVWGLVLLRRAQRATDLDGALREVLSDARREAQWLPTAAFPAALAATLARAELRGPKPSALERQLRLSWAALTGSL